MQVLITPVMESMTRVVVVGDLLSFQHCSSHVQSHDRVACRKRNLENSDLITHDEAACSGSVATVCSEIVPTMNQYLRFPMKDSRKPTDKEVQDLKYPADN